MHTLKLTATKVDVLLQALTSVGWDALPNGHPDKVAAHSLLAELRKFKPPAVQQLRLLAAGVPGNGILMSIVAESDVTVRLRSHSLNAALRVECTLTKLPDGTLQGSNGQTWEVLARL